MKLLVAVSEKPFTPNALDVVARLADGGEVTLLHVTREEKPMERPEEAAPALAETAGYLRGRGLTPIVKSVAGDPTRAILDESRAGFDMIIMRGHDRHPGLLRTVFGDTVTRVLERSQIPVLALRGAHELASRRILLAAGRPSARVLDATASVSRASGSPVTVLHVLAAEPREDFVGDYLAAPGASGAETVQLPRNVESLVAALHERQIEAAAVVREGLVEEQLVEEANSGNYWLVALRARPTGRLSRFLLGHTFAEDVVRHVGTNILMMR